MNDYESGDKWVVKVGSSLLSSLSLIMSQMLSFISVLPQGQVITCSFLGFAGFFQVVTRWLPG